MSTYIVSNHTWNLVLDVKLLEIQSLMFKDKTSFQSTSQHFICTFATAAAKQFYLFPPPPPVPPPPPPPRPPPRPRPHRRARGPRWWCFQAQNMPSAKAGKYNIQFSKSKRLPELVLSSVQAWVTLKVGSARSPSLLQHLLCCQSPSTGERQNLRRHLRWI